MKKLFSVIMAALFAALLFAGCEKSEDPTQIVDIYTPVPAATSVPKSETTAAPTDSPVVTEGPTPAPTEVPKEADQSVFDDAVFLGNSVFEGLYRFGVITHGKFFTKVGLNVNSVFTANIEGSSVPVIDELRNGTYKKAILYFGTNELGWPSYQGFIDKYSAVIDGVLERQPGCRIYVCGVLPTSKAVSDKNENGINNENVARMNVMLKELCASRNAVFIEVPAEFFGPDGALPDDASSDGIHLNLSYDRAWAEHICLKVMGII